MIEAAIAELSTVRDLLRYAVSRFNAGKLVYGHGTTNAVDEASFMIAEVLHLSTEVLATMLDARVLTDERRAILELIELRVGTRRPAAYLVGKARLTSAACHSLSTNALSCPVLSWATCCNPAW
jgi:ribosomal protein L3 glutamine methyltransferase